MLPVKDEEVYVVVVVVTACIDAGVLGIKPAALEFDCRLTCLEEPDFDVDDERLRFVPAAEGNAMPAGGTAVRIAGDKTCPTPPGWTVPGMANEPEAACARPGIMVPLNAGFGRIAT